MNVSPTAATRARHPSETIAAMRPYFKKFGITRIARQTGLDRVGIPCFASIRPNSRTLAVNQGKGLTDAEAQVSAVMEAVEFAVAESPEITSVVATARSFGRAGERTYLPQHLMPLGAPLDEDAAISWVEGRGLLSGTVTWVPLAVVEMGGVSADLPGICHTTNGLASGNTEAEATLHGLCELIERDANTLWCLSSDNSRIGSVVDPGSFNCPALEGVADRIRQAGLEMRMFEQTCDTGVPVFMVAVATLDGPGRHFDVSGGYGASPNPIHAALRALTEATQSRITTIASARDDIQPFLFHQPLDDICGDLFRADVPRRRPSALSAPDANNEELIVRIVRHLETLGIREPIAVDLAGPDLPCRVVRVLCPDLEDMGANCNWRPGPRAIKALTLR